MDAWCIWHPAEIELLGIRFGGLRMAGAVTDPHPVWTHTLIRMESCQLCCPTGEEMELRRIWCKMGVTHQVMKNPSNPIWHFERDLSTESSLSCSWLCSEKWWTILNQLPSLFPKIKGLLGQQGLWLTDQSLQQSPTCLIIISHPLPARLGKTNHAY